MKLVGGDEEPPYQLVLLTNTQKMRLNVLIT
jgi:hypothetical protein